MVFTAIREEIHATIPNKRLVDDGIAFMAIALCIGLNTYSPHLIQQFFVMFPAILRILFWTQHK
jgi:hypothetical protein